MGKYSNTKEFIENSIKTHGDKYDYSKVEYKNANEKVIIICSKHGEFLQKPNAHTSGKTGCPICIETKGETAIRVFLENENINFIPQKKFNECKNLYPLSFDFFLPDYNICIEFDGEQHFRVVEFWNNNLEENQLRDGIKNKFCKENNIRLIRIRYDENVNYTLVKELNVILFSKIFLSAFTFEDEEQI